MGIGDALIIINYLFTCKFQLFNIYVFISHDSNIELASFNSYGIFDAFKMANTFWSLCATLFVSKLCIYLMSMGSTTISF
jgi:hypothetical protein